jgi:hypothetical protein
MQQFIWHRSAGSIILSIPFLPSITEPQFPRHSPLSYAQQEQPCAVTHNSLCPAAAAPAYHADVPQANTNAAKLSPLNNCIKPTY